MNEANIYQDNASFLWNDTDPVLPRISVGGTWVYVEYAAELFADPPGSGSRRKVLPIAVITPAGVELKKKP